ncbi:MAG: nitroreductase family protein [Candidatus Diapherotrites archaeon]|nr:nitroreductase family protein [Candidatus Diapherotrites archaeon]
MERRSIRKYEDKSVPTPLIMKVIQEARKAPSSMDSQPWLFVVVRDAEKKKALADMKGEDNAWMADAPVVIVVCVDLQKSTTRWVEDGSAAATALMIAAAEMGLGTCWVTGYSPKDVRVAARMQSLLNIPSNLVPVVLVPMGFPGEVPAPRKLGPVYEVVEER